MEQTEQRYLTYRQAMEFIGIKSYHTLYNLIDAGLPVTRVGKSPRIEQADLLTFMNSQKEVKQ